MQFQKVKFMGTYSGSCSYWECFYCTEQLNLFLGLLCACYYFIFILVLRAGRSDTQLSIFEDLSMHSIFYIKDKVLLARPVNQEVGEGAVFHCSVAGQGANIFYFYCFVELREPVAYKWKVNVEIIFGVACNRIFSVKYGHVFTALYKASLTS